MSNRTNAGAALAAGPKWFLLTLFALAISIPEAKAQTAYPSKGIEIVVPMGPGGSTDLSARIWAPYMSKKLGVPVTVVNKPGGNTIPAALDVYNSRPDGYTLLVDGNPSATLVQVGAKQLPFKIMDRTFVALADTVPVVIMVPTNSPFQSLSDVVAEVKKSPAEFTWTSMGGVGLQDLAFRQLLKAVNVDVMKTKPIMSQGGAQPMTMTAGGHVKLGIATVSSALPAISGGMVRPLAVTSEKRIPKLPDVPTTTELGYPSINAANWHGISGPPGLPKQVVDTWNKAFQEMVNDPEVLSRLENIVTVPFYRNQPDTRAIVQNEASEVKTLWGLE